ncbi:class I SAM-dependent methyltransferase [Bowmanella denitrificans]|uniref:class I SAM-dependent methyltransferase n=1 Tax=Bowmanella denitrificans TaxID=366582 RepID=UPI000C9CEE17|nr:class I SAM-dependent methyltransferase [Bowmanella denitrificans]
MHQQTSHTQAPSQVMQHDFVSHQNDFEKVYAKKQTGDNGLRFPLQDVDVLKWQRGVNADDFYAYMYRRYTCHILANIDIKDGMDILVLGCGVGSDEKNIKKLYPNCRTWSIDISAQMIERAIASQSPSQFALGVAESLPFPANSFDRIISREVIEHVAAPALMMQEVSRVLRPGGIAMITTENEESWGLGNDRYTFIRDKIVSIGKGIAKVFGVTFEEALPASYKDEAPTLKEFQDYTASAGLTLEKTFWDGALYKCLPVFQHIIGPKRMVRWAHYFSCLENTPRLAFWFCDQVKYKVTKPQSDNETANTPVLTVPGSDSILVETDSGLHDPVSGKTYQKLNGVPDMVPKVENPESGGTAKAMPVKKNSQLYNYVRTKIRFIYRLVLLLVAWLVSVVVTKNSDRPSQFIKDRTWDEYIAVSLRKSRL